MVSSRVVTPGSGVKPVETKVVSMSSSSHRGMEDGSVSYSSSVAVRSWLSSRDGKTKPVDSFFDVYYKCVTLEKEKRSV
ncbi:hypothetical protein [Psychrosphaera algicola]|uniref:Uncharacterized protein n=1 Tax=Psychrosphaera algicola TaxID=3023714 RepID=A0ABT5FAM4_9GAMM|nr:hypothetical protein [Psychrosphaera sp. G1-22]MDC2887631.1 hypothetical protein [Psychrosphaera sp. G1-22]